VTGRRDRALYRAYKTLEGSWRAPAEMLEGVVETIRRAWFLSVVVYVN